MVVVTGVYFSIELLGRHSILFTMEKPTVYFNSFIFETLIIKKYYRHKKRNVVLTHLKIIIRIWIK